MRDKYIKRSFTLLLVLFIMMIPFSFASEINDADTILMDESFQSNDLSTLSDDYMAVGGNVEENDSPSNDGDVKISDYGCWDDLSNDIQNLKPGDIYNIEHDYKKPDNASLCGININVDNVTINGNGHILEGNYKNIVRKDECINRLGNIFTVSSNNVKIINLTFTNGGYDLTDNEFMDVTLPSILTQIFGSMNLSSFHYNTEICDIDLISFSPLCWMGNDGICSDCRFLNNKAIIGSSISWYGNNGVIDNSLFLNNSASRLGGAIYLDGVNCTIMNSYFVNSTSKWANDTIYLGLDYEDGVFKEIHTENNNSNFCIDGRFSCFDPFCPMFDFNAVGSRIDFAKSIFDVLTFGDVNSDNDISYYGQILNGTDFVMTFLKNLDDGILIMQELYFANLTYDNQSSLIVDNVFNAWIAKNFTVNLIYLKYVNVSNIVDYDNAINLNGNKVFGKYLKLYKEYLESFGESKVTCVKGLGVNFLGQHAFKSHSTWKPNDMAFDTIHINGNNSSIIGDAGDRDEYSWAYLEDNCILAVDNLNITKFNHAIYNDGGSCILNNVIFYHNRMDYRIERDWGAAILNAGICMCTNCTFMENYCSNGGQFSLKAF